MSSSNRIREQSSSGRPVFAAWLGIGNGFSAELMGAAGYDALLLDAQHGGITFDNLAPVLQAIDLSGTDTLVRVPGNNQAEIMRALDLGARGVIVPMISTAAQARFAAEAVRYPPEGLRSFGKVRTYYSAQSEQSAPLCFVMIETAEGMKNLDEIAATPGVDGLFVGPVDLALSLGLGVVMTPNDQVLASIEQVVAACRRCDKISGSAAIGLPYARTLLERGVQLIAQGSDFAFIRASAAAELRQLHAWRDEPGSPRAR